MPPDVFVVSGAVLPPYTISAPGLPPPLHVMLPREETGMALPIRGALMDTNIQNMSLEFENYLRKIIRQEMLQVFRDMKEAGLL